MTTIITEKMKLQQAISFKNSIGDDLKPYLAIGKVDTWNIDDTPILPSDSAFQEYEDYIDTYAMKRITQENSFHVIRRVSWENGKVFQKYDNNVADFFNTDFYCVNSNYHVYKCISNNGGAPSTVEPQGTSTSVQTLADGYKWKFMYLVPAIWNKFITKLWVPVKEKLLIDDGSDSRQWDVQQTAIDGAVYLVNVTNGGTGYTASTTITFSGDGTGLTGIPVVESGIIKSITITNAGSGYNFVNVIITGDGTGAAAEAVISPIGGHGSDALLELGGHYLMLDTELEYDEEDKIPVNNDYRKLLIISNPLLYGTNTIATGNVYNCSWQFALSNVNNLKIDQQIEGVNSGATAYIVKIDSASNTIWVTSVRGVFNENETIRAVGTSDIYPVSNTIPPEIKPRSGNIILKEYRGKISRAADQVEGINIVLQF